MEGIRGQGTPDQAETNLGPAAPPCGTMLVTHSLSLSLSPSPLLFLSPLDSVERTGEFSEAFYWKGVQWRRRGRVGKREEGEGGDGEGEAEEGRLGGGGGAHWDLRNKTLQTDKSGTDSAPGLPSFWPWALAQVASSL